MDVKNSDFQDGIEEHMDTVNQLFSEHLATLTKSLATLEKAGLKKSREYRSLKAIRNYVTYMWKDLKHRES